ncbi:MAG: hypothetical protein ACFFA1_01820 [Promethearchaeota archaeon]
MELTLEKALAIIITLSLTLSLGVPIAQKAIYVVSDSHKMVAINIVVDAVDSGIANVSATGELYIRSVYLPNDLVIWGENRSVFYKFYIENWHIIERAYSLEIVLEPVAESGNHFLTISLVENAIHIDFTSW